MNNLITHVFLTSICLVICGTYGHSAEKNSITLPNSANPAVYEDWKAQGCLDHPDTPKCQSIMRWDPTASNDDPCRSAMEKFNTAKSELTTACSDAGIAGLGKTIACVDALAQCSCLAGGSSFGRVDCSRSSIKSNLTSSAGAGLRNLDRDARNFRECPALASREYDNLEKKADKARERADQLEDKLPEKADEIRKARTDAQEKIDNLVKEMNESRKKFQEDIEKVRKDKNAAQQQFMVRVQQKQTEIAQLNDQFRQSALADADADTMRAEKITQIELNCHASASARVNALQQEALALARAGKLNRGGQKDMMRKVGLSDRQSWEREAEKHYRWCLLSKPTVDSRTSANRAYQRALAHSAEGRKSLRLKIEFAQGELNRMLANCSVSTGESQNALPQDNEGCEAKREAAMAQQRLFEQAETDRNTFVQQLVNAQQNAQQEQAMKAMAYQQQQQRAADERARANNYQQALALADQAGATPGIDSKALPKAMTAMGNLTSAAGTLFTCPVCTGNPGKGACKEAGEVLAYVGQTPGSTTISQQDSLARQVQAEEPDRAPSGATQPESVRPRTPVTPNNSGAAEGMKEERKR